MPPRIHVIGIGDDGLEAVTGAVRQTIADAEVLLGTDRTLALVPKSKAERHTISGDLNQLVATIEKAGDKRVALLIYGDPMFYGLRATCATSWAKSGSSSCRTFRACSSRSPA